MAGVGIEVAFGAEYQSILKALERMAHPDKRALLDFAGKELLDCTESAFETESNPATGEKWVPLKYPRKNGSTDTILQDKGTLVGSIRRELRDDSVLVGSNRVYARIHQEGGTTKAHEIKPTRKKALRFNGRVVKKVNHPGSKIPPRPFLGIPRDFDRRLLDDPHIQRLLGL
jgi:phage virion morphogenesis protein